MTLNGIDVSKFQSLAELESIIDKVDWVGVAATEGTGQPNTLYHQQVALARSKGKLVLHYHFFHPAMSVQAQWDAFYRLSDLQPGDCIALDGEASDGLSWGAVAAAEAAWLATARTVTGASPWDYCNLYWKNSLASTSYAPTLSNYPLWLADYTRDPTVLGGAAPWPNLTCEQWTDAEFGSIDGDVFLGDRAAWAALAIPGSHTSPAYSPIPAALTTAAPAQIGSDDVAIVEIQGGSNWRQIPIPSDGRDYAVSLCFGGGAQTAGVEYIAFNRVASVTTPSQVSRSGSWPAWQRDVPGRINLNPGEGGISFRFHGTPDQTLSVALYPVS